MPGRVKRIVFKAKSTTSDSNTAVAFRRSLTFARERPLMSAAVLMTCCSQTLLKARSWAIRGARGFLRELDSDSTTVSYSDRGLTGGER